MHDSVPDWLVIGAPKAGTTTLAAWLSRHPQVCVSPVKEVSYFDLNWDRGPDWYAEHFAARTPGQVTGEATPAYMYVDDALDRIAKTNPDVRLVLVLREPVGRLWSQYWYFRAMGIDARPFPRILRAERRDPSDTPRRIPVGYLASSRYADRLEAVLARFAREQLHIAFFDDLRADPAAVYSGICRHLGVTQDVPPPADARALNAGRMPRSVWLQWASLRFDASRLPGDLGARLRRWNLRPGSYPAIDPGLAARLRTEFADQNRRLSVLLGRPLPAGWTI